MYVQGYVERDYARICRGIEYGDMTRNKIHGYAVGDNAGYADCSIIECRDVQKGVKIQTDIIQEYADKKNTEIPVCRR